MEGFSIRNGLILFKDRYFISQTSKLIPKLLNEFHNSTLGGHSGIERSIKRLSAQFCWKGMGKDIKFYVQNCMVCQQMKPINQKPAGLLMPLPIPFEV